LARIKPIRIRKSDKSEFARLVRNAKAKIYRAKKNYGVDLKGEVELPKLDDFATRKEFNNWKKQITSFTDRSNLDYQFVKNQHGQVLNKRLYKQAIENEKIGIANAERMKKQYEDKPTFSGGKKQLYSVKERDQMFKRSVFLWEEKYRLNFENIDRPSRMNRKLENLEKRADPNYFEKQMDKMKQNYIEGLKKNFNSDADFLVKKFEEIPAADFYEMYLMIDEINFDFHYEPDGEGENEGQLGSINSYLEKYKKGELDLSLKGF